MKIDLHTHSEASKDGGITPDQYAQILQDEVLDCIAITDHDRIDFALGMQKALGPENIIVGEEITTKQGEIIGLFLTKRIPPNLSAQETIDRIKAQNGLVYVPHPFESVRKGIGEDALTALRDDIDIVEGYNGRAFFKKYSTQALSWAKKNKTVCAASSDAHGVKGLGRTYSAIDELPTAKNLIALLSSGKMQHRKPPARTYLLPKYNRSKKLIKGQK